MKKKLLLLHLLTAAFFATAQNVGIGTTAPLTKLHIANGASGATPFAFSPLAVESNGHTYINLLSPAANETAILFGQPGSSANGVIMYNTSGTSNGFQFRNNSNLTRMVIDSSGNVGIGTTSPAFPLSFGTALGDKISLWSNSSNSYGFGIQGGLLQIHTDISAADIGFGYGSSAAFTEIMRIKGDGNVGIGTTSPVQKLHVEGTTFLNGNVGIGTSTPFARLTFTDNSSGEIISFHGTSTNNFGIGITLGLLQIHADQAISDIAFGYGSSTAFTECMRIKGSGNIGIGTSFPLRKLHVEGTTILNGNVGIGTLSGSQSLKVFGTTFLDGNVSIGTLGANNKLEVNGYVGIATPAVEGVSLRVSGIVYFGGPVGIGTSTPSALLDVNGVIKCAALVQTSDSRLKKDIVPIHNSLKKITQLNGYNYYWKNENADNSLQTGILAQEVQKLFPTLVKEGKDGMLSVNYSGLIPVMIESIKEQQQQIDSFAKHDKEQQQQIDAFAKNNIEQQQQINELKKLVEKLLKQ